MVFTNLKQKLVKVKMEDQIGMLTINHPPVNALNAEVMEELDQAIKRIREEKGCRALIIAGSGDRAFVAGADIKEFIGLDKEKAIALCHKGQKIFTNIADLEMPVICAIQGYVLGAGLELALSCDIRVADSSAFFGLPEVGLGILPGYGGTQRLTRLIGAGKAKLLILSGEKFSAEEALQFGIIEKLVSEGQVLPTAIALAKTIFNKAPIAVSKAKKAIDVASFLELEKGLKREAELFGELCETEDKKEGVRAFLEKDRPVFTGK
ncbi:enoyl-CoA hydratase-related protein [Neobacillus sp. PS3-12]|uniref:enoyl-CoA hydratase/isomerase family protein n=1 Tax=Neobacillus sp. PS3-12 TaxID=3070677 RepID=UPI0027E1842D|nr:enoyl-CoA hydratase-related protein [Neobacillus sp. PS3-12]WML53413.1 enoyl-CoA hydratase-related protein [Neobacillus sp. PS3-12]